MPVRWIVNEDRRILLSEYGPSRDKHEIIAMLMEMKGQVLDPKYPT
jgi:hypothetical protein